MEVQYRQYAEMEYKDDYNYGKPYLLAEGYYDKQHFVILSQGGSHPTAYISVKNFPLTKENAERIAGDEEAAYDCIHLNVHGGATYYGVLPKKEDGDHEERFVGWDYGHYGDKSFGYGDKEYTVIDILKDVASGVESLKEEEKRLQEAETKVKGKGPEREDVFNR